MSGIEHLSHGIIEDLGRPLPGQRKTQREKLGLLVATMLDVRSANPMDVAASLPRATGRSLVTRQRAQIAAKSRELQGNSPRGASAGCPVRPRG